MNTQKTYVNWRMLFVIMLGLMTTALFFSSSRASESQIEADQLSYMPVLLDKDKKTNKGALPQQAYLPLDMALAGASAALEACSNDGYTVSVAVVDGAGVQKVHLRADGAGPHTIGSSSGKAYTAASMKRATLGLANFVSTRPDLEGLRDMDNRILILGGGLPIVVDEVVVGGIGVGGAPGGDLDEVCAQVGIDKILEMVADG